MNSFRRPPNSFLHKRLNSPTEVGDSLHAPFEAEPCSGSMVPGGRPAITECTCRYLNTDLIRPQLPRPTTPTLTVFRVPNTKSLSSALTEGEKRVSARK